jgi:hypothetical protein
MCTDYRGNMALQTGNLFSRLRTGSLMKAGGIALVLLLLSAGPGVAGISIIYQSLGAEHFTMAVPDRWMVNVGREPDTSELDKNGRLLPRLVTAMPGDGTPLWFGIWIPPDISTITDAREYMAELGGDLLDEIKVTRRRTDTLNTMQVVYVGGTGKKDKEAMEFYAACIQLNPDTVVIALYIGPHETTVTHGRELRQMIQSLAPISPATEATQ